jgi:hypothetical protein
MHGMSGRRVLSLGLQRVSTVPERHVQWRSWRVEHQLLHAMLAGLLLRGRLDGVEPDGVCCGRILFGWRAAVGQGVLGGSVLSGCGLVVHVVPGRLVLQRDECGPGCLPWWVIFGW